MRKAGRIAADGVFISILIIALLVLCWFLGDMIDMLINMSVFAHAQTNKLILIIAGLILSLFGLRLVFERYTKHGV
jgi:threonine/homoserine/homoserine lactone efflux protein